MTFLSSYGSQTKHYQFEFDSYGSHSFLSTIIITIYIIIIIIITVVIVVNFIFWLLYTSVFSLCRFFLQVLWNGFKFVLMVLNSVAGTLYRLLFIIFHQYSHSLVLHYVKNLNALRAPSQNFKKNTIKTRTISINRINFETINSNVSGANGF